MTLTAGVLSQVSVGSTTASLSATAATGGVGTVTYQWYKSTTSGFSPAGGNLIAGATALTLNDSGLIPGTQLYYKVIATDSDSAPATVTYSQLAVVTSAPTQSQNQFAQAPYLGMIDQAVGPTNVTPVMADFSVVTPIPNGAAVKIVDSVGGVPKVILCTANTDEVFGFVRYSLKNAAYGANAPMEIGQAGTVMYLYATAAIARGVQVCLDITTIGGVHAVSGSGGENVVGWAFDKAVNPGDLIRISLKCPSFAFDGS